MCKSRAEGGRRCAAHTRPAFHAAIDALNTATTRREQIDVQVQGLDAVAFHAATPTGRIEVAALIDHAERTGDTTLAGFLGIGQRMAVGINQGFDEMEAEIAAQRDTSVAADPVPLSPAPVMVATDPVAAPSGTWDPGTPRLDAGEHWSIAEGGNRWHEGGCGAFAIAMTERWPHLKIACEMYQDHSEESVAHAWAYDPDTNRRFHIFGAEEWTPTETPDYDPDSHRVLLDQTPEDVRALFRGRNCSEDTVMDAMDVACEMFDPTYEPDDEYDRNHLYFF